ncbi:hypothetical protein COOONC_00071 [Cooperia oncophora]
MLHLRFQYSDSVDFYDVLKNLGVEVKAAGKYRQQGKTYVVEDGDVILFKFNAGAGLTGAKKK